MATAILRFGANPPAVETSKPNDVVTGKPVTKVQNYFTDTTGQYFAGVWESTLGKWKVRYSESEFCTILEGKCVLTDASGKAETFAKGESFVIPSGFTGTWETIEPVKKLYTIFEAKS